MLRKHHSQPCWGMLSQHFLAFSVQKTSVIKQMQRRVILLADRWYLFSTRFCFHWLVFIFHPSSRKINFHTSYEVFIALTNYVASKIYNSSFWTLVHKWSHMKLIRLCQKIKDWYKTPVHIEHKLFISMYYSWFVLFWGILH